jgi:phage FluMu gp28-like protein
MPFDAQEKFLRGKMRRREKPIARLAMDSTGLGMQMAETMAREFPGRVDQVNLESHRRHELCMLLKDRVDNRRIYFPADDNLREDMSAPTLYTMTNGAMRVRVPQFENADGEVSHADEFMSSVLGTSAAEGDGTWTFAPEVVETETRGIEFGGGTAGRLGMRDEFTSRRLD